MEKTLSVTAIEHGVVIDHIPAGQAVKLLNLLGLVSHKNTITLGLNLQSKHHGLKDIIKIEARHLTDNNLHEIAILAPNATINVIENYKVVKKIQDSPPKEIEGLLDCPNKNCITNNDSAASHFYVNNHADKIVLLCKFCEKEFSRDELKLI